MMTGMVRLMKNKDKQVASSPPIPLEHQIVPIPKPRQTKSDKWKKRPCVMRYRAFADQCRALGMRINESGSHIVFILPMPKYPSWSKKKRAAMDGQPHQQKPDIDNLCKSVLDALHKDDSHIYNIRLSKLWGQEGKIIIIT